MRYKILAADRASDLDGLVNEALAQGWTLQGGVCVTSHGYTYDGRDGQTSHEDWTWAQAMVRPRQEGTLMMGEG